MPVLTTPRHTAAPTEATSGIRVAHHQAAMPDLVRPMPSLRPPRERSVGGWNPAKQLVFPCKCAVMGWESQSQHAVV